MSNLTLIAVLLICHFLGDFTQLSRPWMLSAKRFGSPLLPILAHAAVHAILMFAAILVILGPDQAHIALAIQLPVHFAVDVLKGRINKRFPVVQNPAGYPHWIVFGLDQLLHGLTILLIVWVVME